MSVVAKPKSFLIENYCIKPPFLVVTLCSKQHITVKSLDKLKAGKKASTQYHIKNALWRIIRKYNKIKVFCKNVAGLKK